MSYQINLTEGQMLLLRTTILCEGTERLLAGDDDVSKLYDEIYQELVRAEEENK